MIPILLLLLGGLAIGGAGGASKKPRVSELRKGFEKSALEADLDPSLTPDQQNAIKMLMYQTVVGVFDAGKLGYKAPTTQELADYGNELDRQGLPKAAFACRALAYSLEIYKKDLAAGKYAA